MKSNGIWCLLVGLLLGSTGCQNLQYGWRQERELLDRFSESVDTAPKNQIRPYWVSYRQGWDSEMAHFPDLWDCIKRGYLADKKQIFNE